MKRSMTTPSSATLRIDCRIAEELEAERADGDAGGEIAEDRAEADPLEDRHGDDAGAEQRDGGNEIERRAFQVSCPPRCRAGR